MLLGATTLLENKVLYGNSPDSFRESIDLFTIEVLNSVLEFTLWARNSTGGGELSRNNAGIELFSTKVLTETNGYEFFFFFFFSIYVIYRALDCC